MTAVYQHLIIEDTDTTRTILVNNPTQLNALHAELLHELDHAFVAIAQNLQLRGVLISGVGDRAFAAGADIKAFPQLTASSAHALALRGQEIFQRIASCPVPVVAAVRGYALGGGCELALACHIRIAATSAVFGFPEVTLGLIPGYGGTQRLTDCVGRARAIEWILSAQQIAAQPAYEAGLVSHVVAEEALLSTGAALLSSFAKHPPLATRMALAAIQSRSYDQEAAAFAACSQDEEAQRCIARFLSRKKPT